MPQLKLNSSPGLDGAITKALKAYLVERGVPADEAEKRASAGTVVGKRQFLAAANANDEHDEVEASMAGYDALKKWSASL